MQTAVCRRIATSYSKPLLRLCGCIEQHASNLYVTRRINRPISFRIIIPGATDPVMLNVNYKIRADRNDL